VTDVDLSDDQLRAMTHVLGWYYGSDRQITRMGGLAGTGKTTLIRQIVDRVGEPDVAVCAYTGKAAYVLRSKGLRKARTIHSLIYQPREHCKACDAELGDDNPSCAATEFCPGAGVKTVFGLAPAVSASLIVVDEASMVSSEIHADLMSFGIKILYVGDHGQLEPIGLNPKLMIEPDIRLEQIHRQAEGNAILQFAHHVRQHGKPQSFGPEARVLETRHVPADAHEYDVVLCGKNSTRAAVNAMIRRAKGFSSADDPRPLPSPGERVVCLRNNRDHGIFNGMLATVVEIRCDDTVAHPEIDIVDDEENLYRGIRFAPDQFGAERTLDDVSRKQALFDYGYCLTAHKSQGSAWDRVLVLEWIHSEWSAARWRYTAATRAKHELVWCMRPGGRR